MKIIFTGHRDKRANPKLLLDLWVEFPEAIWCHGNARNGFDRQVDDFAIQYRIACKRFAPDPISYPVYREALLARDVEMAESMGPGDFCVALYDGRIGGGTWYTRKEVAKRGYPIRDWKPA